MEREEIMAEFALTDARRLKERTEAMTTWADAAESHLHDVLSFGASGGSASDYESNEPIGDDVVSPLPFQRHSPGRTARESKLIAAFGRSPKVGDESHRSTTSMASSTKA
jgi:hypothetical protein